MAAILRFAERLKCQACKIDIHSAVTFLYQLKLPIAPLIECIIPFRISHNFWMTNTVGVVARATWKFTSCWVWWVIKHRTIPTIPGSQWAIWIKSTSWMVSQMARTASHSHGGLEYSRYLMVHMVILQFIHIHVEHPLFIEQICWKTYLMSICIYIYTCLYAVSISEFKHMSIYMYIYIIIHI